MKCIYCENEMKEVTKDYKDDLITVTNVKHLICETCNEVYFYAKDMDKILSKLNKVVSHD